MLPQWSLVADRSVCSSTGWHKKNGNFWKPNKTKTFLWRKHAVDRSTHPWLLNGEVVCSSRFLFRSAANCTWLPLRISKVPVFCVTLYKAHVSVFWTDTSADWRAFYGREPRLIRCRTPWRQSHRKVWHCRRPCLWLSVRWSVLFFNRDCNIAKSDFSFVLSVRLSAWNSSAPAGRIFVEYDVWLFFPKSVQKIQVSLKSDMNYGYLTWRPVYGCDRNSLTAS